MARKGARLDSHALGLSTEWLAFRNSSGKSPPLRVTGFSRSKLEPSDGPAGRAYVIDVLSIASPQAEEAGQSEQAEPPHVASIIAIVTCIGRRGIHLGRRNRRLSEHACQNEQRRKGSCTH